MKKTITYAAAALALAIPASTLYAQDKAKTTEEKPAKTEAAETKEEAAKVEKGKKRGMQLQARRRKHRRAARLHRHERLAGC